MGWLYLLAAGIAEIGFATFLKLSENFSKTGPTVGFISFSVLSFWLLTKAMHTISLGTAYGVWTGIGALGTAIVGMLYFKDPVNFARIFFLALLVISIVGLKFASGR